LVCEWTDELITQPSESSTVIDPNASKQANQPWTETKVIKPTAEANIAMNNKPPVMKINQSHLSG
jgi:hypothetical protein